MYVFCVDNGRDVFYICSRPKSAPEGLVLEFSQARWFHLAPPGDDHRASCGECGAFLGPVPLLERTIDARGRVIWGPRPQTDLEEALSAAYGLPVDISAKRGGLAAVAAALNDGDIARAQIATLLLYLPDLPVLAKAAGSRDETLAFAADLLWSGLLKGDWEPEKHPRTGTAPNPGWFAPVPREPKPPRPGWPARAANSKIRQWVRRTAKLIAEKGPLALGGPVVDFILAFVETLSPSELNEGEERAIAQMKSYFDSPKTLDELQSSKCDGLGYEQHHIVEGNDTNHEKFGDDMIDDPSNIVCIPRLKHEEISGYYSSKAGDPQGPTFREKIGGMNFSGQREEGLRVLREKGVLK